MLTQVTKKCACMSEWFLHARLISVLFCSVLFPFTYTRRYSFSTGLVLVLEDMLFLV